MPRDTSYDVIKGELFVLHWDIVKGKKVLKIWHLWPYPNSESKQDTWGEDKTARRTPEVENPRPPVSTPRRCRPASEAPTCHLCSGSHSVGH